jgi:hypothetical protein
LEPIWGAKTLYYLLDILLLCHKLGEIWVNRILKAFPDWGGGVTKAAIQLGLILRLLAPIQRRGRQKPYGLTSAGKALVDIAFTDIEKADWALYIIYSMARAIGEVWWIKLITVEDVKYFINLLSQLYSYYFEAKRF